MKDRNFKGPKETNIEFIQDGIENDENNENDQLESTKKSEYFKLLKLYIFSVNKFFIFYLVPVSKYTC